MKQRIENWVKARSENRTHRALEATLAAVAEVPQSAPAHVPIPPPPTSTHSSTPHPPIHCSIPAPPVAQIVAVGTAAPEVSTDISTRAAEVATGNAIQVPAP